MAKKRVNVKFLAMIGTGVLLLAIAVVVYVYRVRIFKGSHEKYVARAQQLMDQGKYKEAGENLYEAIRIKGADPGLYVMLGDAWMHLAVDEPESLRKGRGCWEQAVAIDPHWLPALQRIFKMEMDYAALNPQPRTFEGVRDAARKLLAVDPADKEARLQVHLMTIRRWAAGVQVDPHELDEASEGLSQLMKDDPSGSEPPYWIASIKAMRSEEARRQGDDTTANQLLDEARKSIDDALADRPNSAGMHYRAASFYGMLAQPPRTGQSTRKIPEADRKKYEQRSGELMEKAQALVKSDDPSYLDIMVRSANRLAAQKKTPEAIQVLRELAKQKPYEQGVRMQLATLLATQKETQAEAIDLLSQPIAKDPHPSGLDAATLKMYEINTQVELLKVRLEALPTDPQQRAAQLKELDALYSKVVAGVGSSEHPNLLGMRGRLEMLKGDYVAAIQTFNRAIRTQENLTDDKLRWMLLLAQCDINTGQTGDAKKLLTQVLDDLPGHTPARIELVRLLLSEKNVAEAKKQLVELRKQVPADSPLLTKFEMGTLDPEKDKQQLNKLFAQLPEKTVAERVDKSVVAAGIMNDYGQAIRLLESVQKEYPDDADLTNRIAQLYDKKGDHEKALAIVKAALEKNPGNVALQSMQNQLTNASPEDVQKFRGKVAESVTDPFTKEILLAQNARDEDNLDASLTHLIAAEQINPSEPRVMEMLFQTYLMKRDWDKASNYMEKLAAADADRTGGLNYRILYALFRGDIGGALEKAQQLVKDRPDFARSYMVLAQVQQRQGNYSEALNNFQAALERQPTNLEAIRGMVDCNYALSRFDDAQRYIRRGRDLAPNNIGFRELEYRHELAYGDPDKVIPPRQDLLKQRPEEPRAWSVLAQTYLAAGRKKAAANDAAAAKDRYNKARDTALGAAKKWPEDPRFVQALAEVSLATKNYAEGEQAIRALLARPAWADKPEAALLLVDFFNGAGKTADAEKTLRELIAKGNATVEMKIRLVDMLTAQNKIDEALAVVPADAPEEMIRYKRMVTEIIAGRTEAAQKEIDAAVAKSGKTPALLNLQANLFEKSNKLPEALAVLDQILAADPRNPQALLLRGRVRMRRGDVAGAIPDLGAARDSMPNETQPRMSLAEAYRARGDIDAAINELEAALKIDPMDRAVRVNLLDLCTKASPPRWAQAEQLFREVHENPQLAKDSAMLHAEALMWLQRNDLNQAMKYVKDALQQAPNDPNIGRTFFEVLTRAKQYREMLGVSEKLAKARPDLWWLFQQRGIAKVRLDDKEGGLAEFEQALASATDAHDDGAAAAVVKTIADEIGATQAMARVAPRAEKDNRWKLFAAYMARGQGDYNSAIKWTEQILALSNVSPADRLTALRVVGTLYAQRNPPDVIKSAAAYKQILEQQPDNIDVLNNLACVMIMPGSPTPPEEALKYSQRAYELMQQQGRGMDPAVMDTHGAILILTGKIEEGINLLRSALDKRQFPDAYYHLGDAYLRQNKPDEAERALKNAQDSIAQMERDKQDVDPTLKSKIEEALAKVAPMRQQMQQPPAKSAGAGDAGK